MSGKIDLESFLAAAREPVPTSAAGKEAARAQLERVLGPLDAISSPVGPRDLPGQRGGPAATAPGSAIAKAVVGQKAWLVAAFLAGAGAHAGYEQIVARTERPVAPVVSAPAAAAAPMSAPSSPPAPVAASTPTPDGSNSTPAPAPPRSPASSSAAPQSYEKSDLAAERILLETARSALERHDPAHAITALTHHRERFPNGQLREERESLFAFALVASGKMAEARAKVAEFHRAFPGSLQGGALDALTADAGPTR
jgi:hypothetical protein